MNEKDTEMFLILIAFANKLFNTKKESEVMKNFKLKPCPFCGNKAELFLVDKSENPEWYSGGDFYKIRCSNEYCLIMHKGVIFATEESAIIEWNTRKRGVKNEIQ